MGDLTEITLDLCCSEGGGAHGMVQAGHYVVGVDTDATCREGYLRSGAHAFICASALDVLADPGFMARFSFVSAHPPCQYYSLMSNCRYGLARQYPELISPLQPLLDAWGGPYLIENVEGARSWLRNPVTMCMWMFGRRTYRHRLLEAGGGLVLSPPAPGPEAWLAPEGCIPARRIRVHPDCGWPHPVPTTRAGHWEPGCFVSVAGHERKQPVFEAMELSTRPQGWMSTRERVKEAIPPYLSYWAAQQLAAWRAAPAGLAPARP